MHMKPKQIVEPSSDAYAHAVVPELVAVSGNGDEKVLQTLSYADPRRT